MADAIKITIDSIYREKTTGNLTITGWAVDTQALEKVQLEIVNQPAIKTINLNEIVREDVNEIYQLPKGTMSGFAISLIDVKAKGTFNVRFIGKSSDKQLTIPLNKKHPLIPGTEGKLAKLKLLMLKSLRYLKKNGFKSTLQRVKIEQQRQQSSYIDWLKKHEHYDLEQMKKEAQAFSYQPKISIVMPVYNVEEQWLQRCVDSIFAQAYSNWELCLADDASTDSTVSVLLKKFQEQDARIKVVFREENGHISRATNSALALATGEFIALMDNDDELPPNALFEVAKVLNENPELDLIYSDEDKIDLMGVRSDPAFKPDWSPDLLLGTNYISHLGVYRRSLVEAISGFRVGYEGSQDYDFVLRFTEKTTRERIQHIPKVLYHWRMLPTSTAVAQDSKGYAFEAGLKAVQDALIRRNIAGSAQHGVANGLYDVHYELRSNEKVSIIIPTKNGFTDLQRCLQSIVTKTTYENYEIIIADNGSTEQQMFELYAEYKEKLGAKFKYVPIDIPFNFSRINNLAVKESTGDYLLFLNNDTEVISTNWLTDLVSVVQFERIGCVGAKLLYPNNTTQHAGIVLGLGGPAGHAHYGYPRNDLGYFGRLALNVNYSAVTAACLIVKRDDFDAVNGFDETLTVAFNDVDFCLKIQALGRDNVWLHGVELYHFESQTRGYDDKGKKKKRFEKEKQMMEQRWGTLIQNDPYYNPNLTRDIPNFSLRIE